MEESTFKSYFKDYGRRISQVDAYGNPLHLGDTVVIHGSNPHGDGPFALVVGETGTKVRIYCLQGGRDFDTGEPIIDCNLAHCNSQFLDECTDTLSNLKTPYLLVKLDGDSIFNWHSDSLLIEQPTSYDIP